MLDRHLPSSTGVKINIGESLPLRTYHSRIHPEKREGSIQPVKYFGLLLRQPLALENNNCHQVHQRPRKTFHLLKCQSNRFGKKPQEASVDLFPRQNHVLMIYIFKKCSYVIAQSETGDSIE